MKTCPPSICAYDQGGECSRYCTATHRAVLLEQPAEPLPVDVDLPDDDRLTTAIHTYRTHRALGCWKAIKKAFRALFRVPVQPVNQ